jgi:iron uptake system component EfeO
MGRRENGRGFRFIRIAALAALPCVIGACGGDDNTGLVDDAEREKQAILEVKGIIQGRLDELYTAAEALQKAAPAPDADGWDATTDKMAIDAMKEQWKAARRAYEGVEGAIAVLFPDLDVTTDARYDAFIEVTPDDNLFDDTGVTGAHAIERVLWADAIPAPVLMFESKLPGYKAAAFPATQAEASDFKDKLCGRFVADVKAMQGGFAPLALDASAAYRGVIGSLQEQIEKINKAATGEEESRYAQFTLADMRANVEAGVLTYNAFQEWLIAKEGGAAIDKNILAGFARVNAAYANLPGDSLPEVPAGWSSEAPPANLLETPFGKLWEQIQAEAEPAEPTSLVSAMLASADKLGVEPL